MSVVPNELRFFVSGPPRPKGRPRFTASGRPYTPASTRAYERTVAIHARAAAAKAGWKPSKDHVCSVRLWVRGGRGDADNVLKAVVDALRGEVYPDDSPTYLRELHVYLELPESTDRFGVLVYVCRRLRRLR
jgi:Holliday junction resolvase RusA-like endonuclease